MHTALPSIKLLHCISVTSLSSLGHGCLQKLVQQVHPCTQAHETILCALTYAKLMLTKDMKCSVSTQATLVEVKCCSRSLAQACSKLAQTADDVLPPVFAGACSNTRHFWEQASLPCHYVTACHSWQTLRHRQTRLHCTGYLLLVQAIRYLCYDASTHPAACLRCLRAFDFAFLRFLRTKSSRSDRSLVPCLRC